MFDKKLIELTDSELVKISDSKYYNKDLAPIKIKNRTWTSYNIAALWMGMSITVPTYMLASSLISVGLLWYQALICVLLGNLIILIPLQLNSAAGTKYGISYPVFARASFGIRGSYIAAMARAIVGIGWFGIQCWLGGEALNLLLSLAIPGWAHFKFAIWMSFIIFWFFNVLITYKGFSSIKKFEAYVAPLLIVISLVFIFWIFKNVHLRGETISSLFLLKPAVHVKHFWLIFMTGLTANIGFWSTLSLNIPDFSRFAKSHNSQFKGQLFGLPFAMTFFAFIGVLGTLGSYIIFGKYYWNPTVLLFHMHSNIAIIVGSIGIILATLTCNVAANMVAPANDISNLNPKKISYKKGVIITGILGIVIMPWYLISSANVYIYAWLGTYAMILGPLAGIYIADYYIVRKQKLQLSELYKFKGKFWYSYGFNFYSILTWIIALILPTLGKFLPQFKYFTANGWVVGLIIAFIIYPIFMKFDIFKIRKEI